MTALRAGTGHGRLPKMPSCQRGTGRRQLGGTGTPRTQHGVTPLPARRDWALPPSACKTLTGHTRESAPALALGRPANVSTLPTNTTTQNWLHEPLLRAQGIQTPTHPSELERVPPSIRSCSSYPQRRFSEVTRGKAQPSESSTVFSRNRNHCRLHIMICIKMKYFKAMKGWFYMQDQMEPT